MTEYKAIRTGLDKGYAQQLAKLLTGHDIDCRALSGGSSGWLLAAATGQVAQAELVLSMPTPEEEPTRRARTPTRLTPEAVIRPQRARALGFFALSFAIDLFNIPIGMLIAGFMGVGFWHLAESQLTYWKHGGL